MQSAVDKTCQGRALNTLFLIVFLSAVNFIMKSYFMMIDQVISNDGPRYVYQATLYLSDKYVDGIKIELLFLYPLLMSLLGRLGLDLTVAGEIISLLASVATILPLYLFFRQVGNQRSAFWSCLTFAVAPVMNKFSVSVMRDPLFLLLAAWSIYFIWRALDRHRPVDFIVAMVMILLSIMTRVEGLLFIPVMVVSGCVAAYARAESRSEILKGLACFIGFYILLAVFGLVLVSQSSSTTYRVEQVRGLFEKIMDHGILAHDPAVDKGLMAMEAEAGAVSKNNLVSIIKNNIPVIYLLGIMELLIAGAWPLFFAFACIGLVCARVNNIGMKLIAVVLVANLVMAYLFNIYSNFLDERYLFVPVLMLYFWTGVGIEKSLDYLRRCTAKPVVNLLLLMLVAVPAIACFREMSRPEAISARQAGEWLAGQPALQHATLVAHGEIIPFYGGRRGDFVNGAFSRDFQRVVSEHQPELIAVETRLKNIGNFSVFEGYRLLARFDDARFSALIFQRQRPPRSGDHDGL